MQGSHKQKKTKFCILKYRAQQIKTHLISYKLFNKLFYFIPSIWNLLVSQLVARSLMAVFTQIQWIQQNKKYTMNENNINNNFSEVCKCTAHVTEAKAVTIKTCSVDHKNVLHKNWLKSNCHNSIRLEMWANAQRDGRPAKHRWRPLFNAAKFGWRPLLDAVQ